MLCFLGHRWGPVGTGDSEVWDGTVRGWGMAGDEPGWGVQIAA